MQDKQRAYTGDTVVMPRRERGEVPRPARGGGPRPPAPRPARALPRRIWPRVRMVLLALLVLAMLLSLILYLQIRAVAGQVVVADARPNPPISSALAGGVNLLIIGVDERPDHPEEGVRSDTLIVAHLESTGRWASLLSIPRDSLANIPGFEANKINIAYSHGYNNAETLYGPGTSAHAGGMALTAQTVEQFLGWPARGQRIDYVAQINFDGFAAIINALGGITIDVPKLIVDDAYPNPDFSTRRVEFQPGPQRMDGETALVYARTRHADSDFGRSERQQQVIQAILTEVRGQGPLGQALLIPRLGDGMQDAVATTMPFARLDTLLALGWLGSGLEPNEIGRVQLDPSIDPGMMQDAYYNLIWTEEGKRAAVDALLTRPSEASEAALVQVLNGTGISGLAGSITGDLELNGFTVIPAADAPVTDVQRTLVYDVTNKPRTARRLANELRAEVRQGMPEGVASNADVIIILGQDAVGR